MKESSTDGTIESEDPDEEDSGIPKSIKAENNRVYRLILDRSELENFKNIVVIESSKTLLKFDYTVANSDNKLNRKKFHLVFDTGASNSLMPNSLKILLQKSNNCRVRK